MRFVYPIFLFLALLIPFVRRRQVHRQRQAWCERRAAQHQHDEPAADEGVTHLHSNGKPPADLDEI